MRSPRLTLWLIAALVAAVGMVAWVFSRRPYERVLELTSGQLSDVSGGYAVVVAPTPPGGTALRVIHLADGRSREVEQIAASERLQVRGGNGTDLFYRVGAPVAASGRRFGLMGLAVEPTPGAEQKRKPSLKPPRLVNGMPEFTLRRAPLAGGAPQVLLQNQPYAGAGVPGPEGFYWVRRRPGKSRPNADDVGELFLSPAVGGPARRLADEVSLPLEPGEGGVYWLRPAGKAGGTDLHFVSADGKTRRVVRGYGGTEKPQEIGNYLYWIVETRLSRPPLSPGAAPTPALERRELLGANRSGENRQVLLKLAEAGKVQIGLSRIQAHQGRLYGLMWESGPPKPDGEPEKDRTFLCEIRPDGEPVLKKLCELPGESIPKGFFDGGWFYFIQQETRENWQDWTRGKMSPTPIHALYRCRLPQ